MSEQGARRVQRVVAETGIPYMTAQVVRFWTGYADIKRLIDSGEVGDITQSYFSRCSQIQRWDNDWMFDPVTGGGALHDMMVHDVDFMNYLFGAAESAYALASKDETRCYNNVFASHPLQKRRKRNGRNLVLDEERIPVFHVRENHRHKGDDRVFLPGGI